MPTEEPALDPDMPIVDPHLHIWDIPATAGLPQEPQAFLLRDAAALIAASGHRVTHTVYVESSAMHRADGPPALRSLGETEFANGAAAMSASGRYGPARIAHRIVGEADLSLGAAIAPVLERHRAAAGERFRGIRRNTAFSPAPLFGFPADPAARQRLADPGFVAGAGVLARMGLSLDVWCLHPQLPQLAALADAVPDLMIILDHLGTPDVRAGGLGEAAAIAEWRHHITVLAARPNVRIKLSGLGMDLSRPLQARPGAGTSERLAARWRPLIDHAIHAFTPARCMFASNFPPDQSAASYRVVWNAFKRITAGCSADEKDRLFRRTAAETYRIDAAAGSSRTIASIAR